MISLSKTRELTVEDFKESNAQVRYNEHVNKTVADFYDISAKEKEILLSLAEGFKSVAENIFNKKITVSQYAQEVENLNQKAIKYENITVGMNKKNEFEVSLKADLKRQYQNDSQLGEKKQTPKKPAIFSLYAIEWEESERSWGIRPDGFSFHRSPEEATQYIKDFWATQPKEVQDEYSRPCYENARLLEVSESLHDYVMENGSVWLVPKTPSAYKTYDTTNLKKPKNKM